MHTSNYKPSKLSLATVKSISLKEATSFGVLLRPLTRLWVLSRDVPMSPGAVDKHLLRIGTAVERMLLSRILSVGYIIQLRNPRAIRKYLNLTTGTPPIHFESTWRNKGIFMGVGLCEPSLQAIGRRLRQNGGCRSRTGSHSQRLYECERSPPNFARCLIGVSAHRFLFLRPR